jgi:hypothetical protein
VFVSASADSTTTRLAARPGRVLTPNDRRSWGTELTGTYRSDKATLGVGAFYRFEYRWLADGAYANAARSITAPTLNCNAHLGQCRDQCTTQNKACDASCDTGTSQAQIAQCKAQCTIQNDACIDPCDIAKTKCSLKEDTEMLKEISMMWWNTLPVLTLGGEAAWFSVDSEKNTQNHLAQVQGIAKVDWRIGVYLEAAGTLAFGRETAATDAARDPVEFVSTSGSVVFLLPALLATNYWNEQYAKSLYQAGIAIGPTITFKKCLAPSEDVRNCGAKATVSQSSLFLGGLVDFRVIPSISPRLTVGWRTIDAVTFNDAGARQMQFDADGLEATIQVGGSLSPGL